MDGFLVETTGQCKQGMDIAYDGTWGYHALVLTLANTGEVLSIVNRPGNRPSHEGAADAGRSGRGRVFPRRLSPRPAAWRHQVLADGAPGPLGRRSARSLHLRLRGACRNLKAIAEDLPARAWRPLQRPARYEVKTHASPAAGQRQGSRGRGRGNSRTSVCVRRRSPSSTIGRRPAGRRYRMVVVSKNISVEKGENGCCSIGSVYFFYITNDWVRRSGRDRLLGQRSLRPGERAGAVGAAASGRCGLRWTIWRATGPTW